MIGRGWKMAALFLMIFLMAFVIWELRDFGEPSGDPVDRDLDDRQDVGEDGRLVWDDRTGQIDIHDAGANTTIRQDRTMMDDAFISGAADPDGTVNTNNVVTSIVFDYRGFDTLGEATVLFAAVTGVLTTIRIAFPGKRKHEGGEN